MPVASACRRVTFAPLALGEAREGPVTAQSRLQNLPRGAVGPQLESFAFADSEKLPAWRGAWSRGRLSMLATHVRGSTHAALIRPR